MNKKYQANPVVSLGDEEDGAILYNPDTDVSSIINLSGRELLIFLQTPHTVQEMAAHLVSHYSNVSLDQATEDATLFVTTLLPDFLLEMTADNATS
jgi:hypothetical protein